MKGHCVWLVWRPCTAATIAPLFSRTIQSDRSTATLCTKMILSLANGAHLYSCVLRRFARVLTESFVYLNQAVVYRFAGALRILQEFGISTFDRELYHLLATTRAPCASVFKSEACQVVHGSLINNGRRGGMVAPLLPNLPNSRPGTHAHKMMECDPSISRCVR